MSRRRRRVGLAVLGVVAVAGCGGSDPAAAPVGFGTVLLEIAGDRHCAWLAETPAQRQRGLMGVEDLDGKVGMLFRFEEDTTAGFWMRATPLPLRIAFVAADETVVSVETMAPCSDSPDCPAYHPDGPYRTALEVPVGGEVPLAPGAAVRELRRDC